MLAGAVAGAAQAVADSPGGTRALIKNAASGIADGVAASMMGVQSAGSNGSFSIYYASNVELSAIFYDIADRDLDHHGAPLCTTTTLSRIPGYLMISDADVYIPCYPEELEAIQRALTTGFYLEDVSTPPVPEAVIEPLSITENGTYTAAGSVDGYSPITVNVPQGITPTGNINIAENGTYEVTEYASAVVNVPQGITPAGNINITDTSETDVTNYATAQVVDVNLVAANIKKDVSILGVLGSFEGGGGSLPSVIGKIDGGSFTPSSDTLIGNYDIVHNLGETPKGFKIRSANDGGAYDVYTIKDAALIGSSAVGYSYFTNDTTERIQTNATLTATNTEFKITHTAMYYKAGVTYEWLAWA